MNQENVNGRAAGPLGQVSPLDDDVIETLAEEFLNQADLAGIDRERLLMHLWVRETEGRLKLLPRKLQHEFCTRLLIRFFVATEESE